MPLRRPAVDQSPVLIKLQISQHWRAVRTAELAGNHDTAKGLKDQIDKLLEILPRDTELPPLPEQATGAERETA